MNTQGPKPSADRFFRSTLSGGELHISGVQPWETWDSSRLDWQTEAHVNALMRESKTVHKVKTLQEWDAIVRGPGPSHVATIWVHANLESVARGRFEMTHETLASFNQNIVLFKNLRRRLRKTHETSHSSLKEMIEQSRGEIEAMRGEDGRFGATTVPFMESRLSMMNIMQEELDLLGGEEEFGRRTAFVYLMAVFEGFIAGWFQDMGLRSENVFESGTPVAIREACQRLKMDVTFPPDFDPRLIELRERRNVFVHRAGRADRRYCDQTYQQHLRGQRLDVGEDYLDKAEAFITHVVWECLVTNSPLRQP